jgi:hypothetical protein
MTVSSLTEAISKDRLWTRATGLSALRILAATGQLGLAILVIRAYALEGPTFYRMFTLAALGFVVGAVLPRPVRQPWFILVSFVGIGAVLGLHDGAWLVAIGLSLIALCHLPVSWWARVGVLLAAGAGLAASRSGVFKLPLSIGIWPVLGAMFMFRLIVYMHHLRHNPGKVSIGRALAYFFMLPSVAFPLFPVMDYKTFDSTYYDQDAFSTYQTGLRYIARGLFHLVVYRFIYYYVVRDPAELTSLADLLTYVVSTFLVYVRVSGQFWIIVGILHLFGYRMPRPNNLYYLASGFTDIWRRNNIYWKDFMMKLVYYPSFFRLRRQGQKVSLIGALLLVFLITWLLHSYQWFWIRGDFPITAMDALFWGCIGFFMLLEMLRETARPPAERARQRPGWSLRRAVKTVGFFLFFSCLWAMWDSQTPGDFISLWTLTTHGDTRTVVTFVALLLLFLAIAGWSWGAPGGGLSSGKVAFWRRESVQTVAVCTGLLAFAYPQVTNTFGLSLTRFAQSLRETKLNERDAANQARGYYQQLNTSGGLTEARLGEVNGDRPGDWVPLTQTRYYRELNTFLGGELVPNTSEADFKGERISTNRWGMRDQNYDLAKPAHTFRMALLGPSDVMGAGVSDSQTFEALLEARLNRELSPHDSTRYEILNFGVVSYSVLQDMEMFKQRALRFQPDMVIVAYHPISDARFAFQFVANLARYGAKIPYDELEQMVKEAGVKPGMRQAESFRRLKPYGNRMVEFSLRRIHDLARERGMGMVLLVRDLPAEHSEPEQPILPFADSLGFAVVDIRGVYAGRDPQTLLLASWDKHPNALGHHLIADRLFTELVERRSILLPKPR